MTPIAVPLAAARDEHHFGGKAVQLGAALQAGLPVPDGVAFAWEDRDALLGPAGARALAPLLDQLGGLVAVRSSAVGEDSSVASFAGQHATVLGVRTAEGLCRAVAEVHASALTNAAVSYRLRLGLDPDPRMGIVVQRLVPAEVAGVLFNRDPVTGEDVRVVEAAWGLGEAVVQGIVTPDSFRVARGGRVLARRPGDKDVLVRWRADGGTEEVPVDPARAAALCLDDDQLGQLDALTTRCESLFGGSQDLEFAFAAGRLFLLQRRAITRA